MDGSRTADVIELEESRTLAGLFRERVRRTPDAVAYHRFDHAGSQWRTLTWLAMAHGVAAWQALLAKEGLAPGERVAVMARNSPEWVAFDQAALGLGLVVVPLHVEDNPDNLAFLLRDCGARVVMVGSSSEWQRLKPVRDQLPTIQRIFAPHGSGIDETEALPLPALESAPAAMPLAPVGGPDDLATIIYTSGTTGGPKGVMLSHRNILSNARTGVSAVTVHREDLFLSFLPLAHALERTVGYYLPMTAGASVAFARSIPLLAEDLRTLRPTAIVSVPRIYERVYGRIREQLATRSPAARALFQLAVDRGWERFEYLQGRRNGAFTARLLWPLLDRLCAQKLRANLGGRVRIAICGGAPLAPAVAKVFLALGVPLLQGYGMTEAAPVTNVNRLENNEPASVGPPFDGVEMRLGEQDEILVRGPNVMMGYWNNPQATARAIDKEGWLHTGDIGRIEQGRVYVTGRLKEIIVLANGTKVPPEEVEMAIRSDPLFEHVMVIGDRRPFLSALTYLSPTHALALRHSLGLDEHAPFDQRLHSAVIERLGAALKGLSGYAKIRRVACTPHPWGADNGLLTPTLKLRRDRILHHHAHLVEELYRGHEPEWR